MKLSKLKNILDGIDFFDKEANFSRDVEVWAEGGENLNLVMIEPKRHSVILASSSFARDYLDEAGEDINKYKIIYEE